jgi:hypothetical protein
VAASGDKGGKMKKSIELTGLVGLAPEEEFHLQERRSGYE